MIRFLLKFEVPERVEFLYREDREYMMALNQRIQNQMHTGIFWEPEMTSRYVLIYQDEIINKASWRLCTVDEIIGVGGEPEIAISLLDQGDTNMMNIVCGNMNFITD
jgi:hypothetical protein